MTRTLTLSKALIALLALSFAAPSAFAARKFEHKHPRRAEVNEREQNQKERINEGVKDGTITKSEAKEDRKNLRNIKAEEKADVKANGGHLTKDEQKDLNQKLDKNSKQIGQEKHEGSTAAPKAPAAPAAPAAPGTPPVAAPAATTPTAQ